MNRTKAVIVTGPTATGKTRLAVRLALRFNGEIIGADSRQVYKGLDIGSGKDIGEYQVGDARVSHRLIDIVEPSSEYNLMQYRLDFEKAFKEILLAGKTPFVAGGSPLYISAIINDYELEGGPRNEEFRARLAELSNKELAEMIRESNAGNVEALDVQNRNRLLRTLEKASSVTAQKKEKIDAEWLIIGTYLHRKTVHEKIRHRLDIRLNEGMLEEVAALHDSGLTWERLERFGLEYKWCALYLQGKISFCEMKNTLEAKIRQFAKRQDIWFRKLERQGWEIHWINPEDIAGASRLVEKFFDGKKISPPSIKLSEIFY